MLKKKKKKSWELCTILRNLRWCQSSLFLSNADYHCSYSWRTYFLSQCLIRYYGIRVVIFLKPAIYLKHIICFPITSIFLILYILIMCSNYIKSVRRVLLLLLLFQLLRGYMNSSLRTPDK